MSNNIPAQQQSQSKPVLVLTALAAVCTVIVGALSTINGLPTWVVPAVAVVGVVATTIGGVLTKGQVTPWKDVAAKVTPLGVTVAGPAADVRTGSAVDVVPGAPNAPPV